MTSDQQGQAQSSSESQTSPGDQQNADAHPLAATKLLNRQNVAANAGLELSLPPRPDSSATITPSFPVQFRSNTIAPSPPLARSPSGTPTPHQRPDPPPPLSSSSPSSSAAAAASDELRAYQPSPLGGDHHHHHHSHHSHHHHHHQHPPAESLQLETDVPAAQVLRTDSIHSNTTLSPTSSTNRPSSLALQHKTSSSSLRPISRTPSFKAGGFYGSHSATSSAVPSPIISAMGDVTPLPSPLLLGDSPGPWRKMGRRPSHEAPHLLPPTAESVLVTSNGESVAAALANQVKRKVYAGLASGLEENQALAGSTSGSGNSNSSSSSSSNRPEDLASSSSQTAAAHTRNRSISEYVPDPLLIPKRMVTVSGSRLKTGADEMQSPFQPHMRREPHLSEARGLTPIEKPPTPPPSESSLAMSDSGRKRYEYFEARGRNDGKRRRWRAVKLLGQGTFSRVMLATSQISPSEEEDASGGGGGGGGGEPSLSSSTSTGMLTPEPQPQYDRRTLVAVKVCEHGPKGGASEDRIEMSLKRELEIMQTINHPSLVHLKAWNIESTRAILVLSYCPGGDLFDVASAHREVLTPPLLRRIFAEVVGAVRYLHERRIVHRDIKLENVLVNLPPQELADPSIDWTTYPYSVATVTDLGLSRRVADDEKLETRCGSDDYAAPEVIMGQPYDGRATDAWSLGVLLYALLEGRLPFDPTPGMPDAHRMRSRTSHRIARVEWRWIRYAGDDGDHDADANLFAREGLDGAREITEGLLKRARSRWSMDQVAACDWVKDAIAVQGGLRFREEEEGAEVL